MTYGNPSIDACAAEAAIGGRPAPRRAAALPAVFGDDDGRGARPGGCGARALARAARAAPDRGLSRRARPRRGTRGEHRGRAHALRSPAVFVPRHPAPLCGRGRSLRRAVPGDRPARRRAARAARGALVGRIPVARRAARAGSSPTRRIACANSRQAGAAAPRGRLPRIRGGLPRDARGDRDPRRRDLHRRRRRSTSSTSPRSTTTPRRSSASRACVAERLGRESP